MDTLRIKGATSFLRELSNIRNFREFTAAGREELDGELHALDPEPAENVYDIGPFFDRLRF